MQSSTLSVLKRLYYDTLRSFIAKHKCNIVIVITIIISGIILGSLAPLAIVHLISYISESYKPDRELTGYYIAAFILLKFLGQAIGDLRWRAINPLLYAATYNYCQMIVHSIASTFRVNNGFSEAASQISERTAILSKMQIGSMAVLHGLLMVIFPAMVEITIIMVVVYSFVGPGFIVYFFIAAGVLYVATSIGRAREINLGHTSYEADNNVLTYCGDMLAHTKLNREMEAGAFFKNRLNGLIDTSMAQYNALFSHKYRRASYLTLSVSISYILVFAWAAWLIYKQSISASQIFLLVIYLERVLAPVTGASAAINSVQHGVISIGAGYDLLDELQRKARNDSFMVDRAGWDRVQMSQSMIFEHKRDTLHIGVGKRIRFTGHSGTGKSTYLRRIYRKLLDTQVIESHQLHYLSAQVEWVQGTLFDNIALGYPGLDQTKVKQALDQWSQVFGNRVLTLDQQMQDLSAGERQWIAILRSALRKPQVLFMDEATNSLDVRTEPLVWNYLLANIDARTTLFIVTHQARCPIQVDHEELIGEGINTTEPHPPAAS